MCVLLITRLLRRVGRWARKPVNHTSWVTVGTPTDSPKSVRNRCLIELFVALLVLSGAAVAEWLSSWFAEQEVRGSIPRLATWISEIGYLLLPSRDMAEIPLKRR